MQLAKIVHKKSIFLVLIATLLITLGIVTIPSPKTVSGQQKVSITVSSGQGSYQSGGLISLASTDEPSVDISAYGASGEAEVWLYQTTQEALINYLIHDKDNNQLNKNLDSAKVQLITSQKAVIGSPGQSTKVLLPLSPTGIWLLSVSLADGVSENFITRSQTGVMVKEGDNEYIFWGQNFKTKKSVTGGNLKLYSLLNRQKEIDSASFGNDGIAKLKLLPEADIGIAIFGDDTTIIPINLHYLNTGYDYSSFKTKVRDTKYFVFTDRPLYKPGDTVYFKAVIRDDDDAFYTIPKGSASVKIYKDYNVEEPLVVRDFPISADGTVFGEYRLSPEAPAGFYEIKIAIVPQGENSSSGYASFQVEYYRKPEYSINLTTDKLGLIAGDKSSVQVSGEYFFGQPLSNQKIKYTISSANYYQYDYLTDQKTAVLDDYRYGFWGADKILEGDLFLNEKGQGKITFDAKIPPDKNPSNDPYYQPRAGHNQVYSIEAQIDDGSGNPAFARKNILIYAGEYGIFRKEHSVIGKVGQTVSLPLILVPYFNASVSNINLTAKIHWENWDSYQEPNKKYLSYKKVEEDLPSIGSKTDASGNTTLSFAPQKAGSYKFTVEGKDRRGNLVSKSFYTYVTSDKEYYSFDYYNKGTQITVTADKTKYQPNESAKLIVFSQIPDRDIFLALERGGVRRYQIIRLEGHTQNVDIPLIRDDIPNIWAEASSFSDSNLGNGSANLVVSADSKKLIVNLTTNQKKYGPGEVVKVDVQTIDINGQPVSADVALWAVDKAIFELVDERPETIFNAFWETRYDNTSQSHSLEGIGVQLGGGGGCFAKGTQILMADGNYNNIEEVKVGDYILTRNETDSKLIKAKIIGTHQQDVTGYIIINGHLKVTPNHRLWINQTWKQAGSVQVGDFLTDYQGKGVPVTSIEWLSGKFKVYNLEVEKYRTFFASSIFVHNQKGGAIPRSIFKDTAYWNPQIHTDTTGKAQITFQLPDNLTSWVISAVGSTIDTQVGQIKSEIIVQKDIFIRPILPNIFRTGDSAVISAIVHNYTDRDQNLNIEVQSDSLQIKQGQKQNVIIKSTDNKQLYFKVLANKEADPAQITFTATAKKDDQAQDTVISKIPIRPFGFYEKDALVGQGSTTFALKLAEDADKQKGKITLTLAPTLIGPIISGMKYLVGYPYGCVEQITSRLVPALMVKTNPQLFQEAVSGKNVDQLIQQGLNRLSSMQHPDGGFSWWSSGQSNHFVTAYVVENLILAKSLGFRLSNDLLNNAKRFLEQEQIYNPDTKQPELLTEHQQIARIYGLTLLRSPRNNIQIQTTNIENLTPDLLSLAVLANMQNGNKDPDTNGLNKLLSLAKTQAETIYFEAGSQENFGSVETSTALAIRAMLAGGINQQYITQAVRFLMRNRTKDYFANTFATSQVVKALSDFTKNTPELTPALNFTVNLDGKIVTQGIFDNIQTHYRDIIILPELIQSPSSNLSIQTSGPGQLYSTLTLEQFHTDREAKAVNKGFSIKREYASETGGKIAVGETVTVKLTIQGPETENNYAIIKDELPAGLVPINVSFKNEPASFEELNRGFYPQGTSSEITDTEVTENGMILSLYQVTPGTKTYSYKTRAVSEGIFITPPAHIELMYNPQLFGRSDTEIIAIAGAPKEDIVKSLQKDWLKFIQQNNRIIVFGSIAILAGAILAIVIWKRR